MIRAVPGGVIVVLIPSDALMLAWVLVVGVVLTGYTRAIFGARQQLGWWRLSLVATLLLGAVAVLVLRAS